MCLDFLKKILQEMLSYCLGKVKLWQANQICFQGFYVPYSFDGLMLFFAL